MGGWLSFFNTSSSLPITNKNISTPHKYISTPPFKPVIHYIKKTFHGINMVDDEYNSNNGFKMNDNTNSYHAAKTKIEKNIEKNLDTITQQGQAKINETIRYFKERTKKAHEIIKHYKQYGGTRKKRRYSH